MVNVRLKARFCPVRLLTCAVLLACGAQIAAHAADEDGVVTVAPGERVTRVHRGTPLTFELELPPGDWLVEATERHADVRLLVTPSGGGPTKTYDGPDGGADTVLWIESGAQSRRITVRAETAAVVNREGELTIGTSPIPLPTGRLIRDAAAAETRIAELASSTSFADREQALAAARDAAALWRRVGEPARAARALLTAAAMAYRIDQLQLAQTLAMDAHDTFRQVEQSEGAGFSLSLAGLIAIYLRDTDRADALLARAEVLLAPRYEQAGINPATSNRCFADMRRRRLEQAEACYRRLQQLAAERGALASESIYLNNLGGINAMRGDPARAIEFLVRAEALARGLGDERGAAKRAVNIGTQYTLLDDLQRALDYYQRGLAYFRRVGDAMQSARVLNNIGLAYLRLGEANRSLPFLEEAYELRQRGEDVALQALAMNNLGAAHMALGDAAEAKRWHARALGLSSSNDVPDGTRTALLGLARAERALGNTADGVTLARRALAMLGESGNRVARGTAHHEIGVALIADGRPDDALAPLQQALALRRETGYGAGQAETLTALASARVAVGNDDAALADALRAIDLIENLRTDVASPDLRASFQSSVAEAFEIAIEMQMKRRDPAERLAALTTAERYRARGLVDALARGTVMDRGDVPAELVETRDRLRGEINRRSLGRLGGDADDAQIAGLLAELDVVEARIAARDPRFRALARPVPPSPADMQALLDDDTIVLQYFLGSRRSFGWTISRTSIDAFELPPKARLARLAREAHLALSRRARDDDAVRDLGDLLLAPAAESIAAFERLAVMPDGALHYLPFVALDADARHGVRDKVMVYVPSFTTLDLLRETGRDRPPAKELAVLADPVFNGRDPRLGESAPERFAGARDAANPDDLNRLSMTATEADLIGAMVPPDAVSVRTGFDATAAALRHEDVRDARRLHIATHGVVDSRFPAMSGLVLSMRAPDGSEVAGFVGLRDIYGLRLNAELVVLSACETAIGREMRGEGLLGLTRGFMFAGATRVVASLWQVEDRVTAEFMRAFYSGMLRDGLAPEAALTAAQRAIRADRRWRHPYYWSAFTLQGDWRRAVPPG